MKTRIRVLIFVILSRPWACIPVIISTRYLGRSKLFLQQVLLRRHLCPVPSFHIKGDMKLTSL